MAEMIYKTPEEFGKVVDAFIDEVKKGNIPRPTDYQLCEFAHISIATLNRYYYSKSKDDSDDIENNIYKGYDKPLKKLIAYRSDRLEGIAEANPKQTTAAIFLLKQKHNGGYQDRQIMESKTDSTISLTVKSKDGTDFKR